MEGNDDERIINYDNGGLNNEYSNYVGPDTSISEFPGFSRYMKKRHCCIEMTYYPDINKYFIGEWEFSPYTPIIVLSLISSSYIVLCYISFVLFTIDSFVILVIELLIGYFFIYSYISVIKVGPGYLPFYWSARHELNVDDIGFHNAVCPDGVVTDERQLKWARSLSKPQRTSLFTSARRIVVRPDHLCMWTTVWIGKKNFKLFFLFNFYGMLYTFLFCVQMLRGTMNILISQWGFISTIITLVYLLLGLAFFVLVSSFTATGLCSIKQNRTSLEEWGSTPQGTYDRGRKRNFEDVFGPSDSILDWLTPTSPFEGYNLETLANLYEDY